MSLATATEAATAAEETAMAARWEQPTAGVAFWHRWAGSPDAETGRRQVVCRSSNGEWEAAEYAAEAERTEEQRNFGAARTVRERQFFPNLENAVLQADVWLNGAQVFPVPQ